MLRLRAAAIAPSSSIPYTAAAAVVRLGQFRETQRHCSEDGAGVSEVRESACVKQPSHGLKKGEWSLFQAGRF